MTQRCIGTEACPRACKVRGSSLCFYFFQFNRSSTSLGWPLRRASISILQGTLGGALSSVRDYSFKAARRIKSQASAGAAESMCVLITVIGVKYSGYGKIFKYRKYIASHFFLFSGWAGWSQCVHSGVSSWEGRHRDFSFGCHRYFSLLRGSKGPADDSSGMPKNMDCWESFS